MKQNNIIMKINILPKASLILLVCVASMSCRKDLLGITDPNTFNYATYFNTPDEIRQGSTAVYLSFYNNDMMGFQWPEMFDVLANEAQPSLPALANEPMVSALWQYQFENTNTVIGQFWKMCYQMILRSNLVLDKGAQYIAKNGDDNAHVVSRSMGEAYFLRGYAYFQLAFYWGKVPIRKTYDQSNNINAPRAASADDVWAVAEDDFKKAQALLPEKWDDANVGRATSGAATGFLGKLYLFTNKYTDALAQFNSLNGKYSLLPGAQWEENFGETNKNNAESLFEVQFQWFDGNWWLAPITVSEGVNNLPGTQSGRQQLYGWNDWGNWFFPSRRANDFVYTDETGSSYTDPRAQLTFYGGIGDMTWMDKSASGPRPYDFATLGYWYKKILNKEYKETENNLQSSNNLRLLRYADVLLMAAECKLDLNDVQGCVDLINQVRTRIGAFAYQKTYSKDQAFDLLKRERQLELMGEQHRFDDLKRWNILVETMNVETQALFGAPRVSAKHQLFPIPLSEIDTNLGLGTVNDQWN
jgi:hypothetical protein